MPVRVGVAGLGKMGSAFAENLIAHGYEVRVWDRSADRTAALVTLGAQVAATPEELVAGMDVVLAMLWDDAVAKEIEALATQPELCRQMSQSGMLLARETYNWDRFADQVSRVCQEVVEREGPALMVSAPARPLTRP